jgi:hypothetical protein
MKKQRLTVADQIEISLRSGNREMQAKLDSINAQCEFVMANSDNVSLKQFAAIVQGIANQDL